MTTTVTIREWEKTPITSLTKKQCAAIAKYTNLKVSWDGGLTECTINPSGVVGVYRFPGGQLAVESKVPIQNLTLLWFYADSALATFDDVELKTNDFVVLSAQLFAKELEAALKGGMYKAYVHKAEAQEFLRGRLDINKQISRHFLQALPLELNYKELSFNVPENQILLTTLSYLESELISESNNYHSSHNPLLLETLRRTRALRREFTDIDRLRDFKHLPQWTKTPLNSRFHRVLHMGELILQGARIELEAGELHGQGYELQVEKIFESFLTKACAENSAPYNVRDQVKRTISIKPAVTFKPDIIVYREGTPVAVLDAKYKYAGNEKSSHVLNADVYQLTTYAVNLGLNAAALVYAGSAPTSVFRISESMTVIQFSIDLSLPLADCIERAQEIRDAMIKFHLGVYTIEDVVRA